MVVLMSAEDTALGQSPSALSHAALDLLSAPILSPVKPSDVGHKMSEPQEKTR
jgi:hypothetical protein